MSASLRLTHDDIGWRPVLAMICSLLAEVSFFGAEGPNTRSTEARRALAVVTVLLGGAVSRPSKRNPQRGRHLIGNHDDDDVGYGELRPAAAAADLS